MLKINKENGATAIEYGILTSLIGVVIIGGLSLSGVKLSQTFCNISSHLVSSNSCSNSGENGNTSNQDNGYSGAYSSDINSFMDDLQNKEQKYIAAWKAVDTENQKINQLRQNNQSDEANSIINSDAYKTLQTNENNAYESLRNGNSVPGDYGLTTGLNKIYSHDRNQSLSSSGQDATDQIFSTINNVNFKSSIGNYTLGSLNNDSGNSYLNDLNSHYPKH